MGSSSKLNLVVAIVSATRVLATKVASEGVMPCCVSCCHSRFALPLVCNAAAPPVTAGTLSITFTNPTDTLDNVWFLYDRGDLNWAFAVPGTAPAGTVTALSLCMPAPRPVPGNPAFGVVATYGGSKPAGVYAALEPSVASALILAGKPFSAAFPGFSACSEGDLMSAMAGTGDCLGIGMHATVTAFGADAYYLGNAYPFGGAGQLTPYSGLGDTASLVKFSNATAGGSTTVVFTPVPEVGAWATLACGLLVLALVRRRRPLPAGC